MASPLNFEPNDELAALVREETDFSLLKLMADRNKDEAWADAAFCEFYSRHHAYMWTVCDNAAEKLNGDAWVQDVFFQTFEVVYEKAGAFKLPAGTPPESGVRLVRGWMGKIAANLLRQILKGHMAERSQDSESWDRITRTIEGDPKAETDAAAPELSIERQLITQALETLSEREQLVLRTTFQYYRIGEKFQRLPNKVSSDLANQLATTPENLRKIRERALEKVREYIKEHQKSVHYEPPIQK